jgi:hypothetical protein
MSELFQPKVFLSYSWSSDEYADRIVDLANRLRADGIDVVLDRAHLTEGQDLYKFMERSVNDPTVTHVLLLCDPLYAEKADGREGGVGKETTIVSPDVYASATQTKFIPVIMQRREDGTVPTPAYLKTRLYFDLSDPETEEFHYQRLKRRLYGKLDVELAPLGGRPADLDESQPLRVTVHTAKAFIAAAVNHRPQRWALLEDYCVKLAEAVRAERIAPGHTSAERIRELHLASIDAFLPYRDEFVEVVRSIARHADDSEAYDRLHRLFEDLAAILYDPSVNEYADQYATANLVFIVRELFLYAVAVLLDAHRFPGVQRLLSRYFVASARGGGAVRTVDVLDRDPGCIEMGHSGRRSSTGQLLRQRATLPRIDVTRLQEAEFVCVVRSRLDSPEEPTAFWDVDVWWPRLLTSFDQSVDRLPLVTRLQDPHFRNRLARVFEAESAEALKSRIAVLPELPRTEFPALAWANATQLLNLFGFTK